MGSPRLSAVFERIDAALAEGVLPVCVFDLDSTLFSTAPRNLRILEEFLREHASLDPLVKQVWDNLRVEQMGWNVHDDLRRMGITDEVLLARLKAYWFERFFTDEYLASDTAVAGAPEFVTRCHQRGALIYYLTGRHVGGMELGTVRALSKLGFPFWRGRCVVHLKPSFEMNDRAFKDDALADIRSYQGRVVATFENEPGNANMFARAFPAALHFLLLTIHSPDAEKASAALIESEDFVVP